MSDIDRAIAAARGHQIRLGRLRLGFWPQQEWGRFTRVRDCPCCAWNLYVGPFGVELRLP